MPLDKGMSVPSMIKELVESGHDPKQAVAIAYHVAGEKDQAHAALVQGGMSPNRARLWLDAFDEAYTETGDLTAALLAGQGALTKAQVIGVKSVDDEGAIIAGWALIFTTPDNPDLKDTYFPDDVASSLLLDYYENAPLFFDHGRDPQLLWQAIGVRTATKLFPRGVWLEHRVYATCPKYQEIIEGVRNGLYGYSSDSIEHMVERGFNPADGALHAWPMVGCSITPDPAEPALGPVTLGSFATAMKSMAKAREAQGAEAEPLNQTETTGETIMDPKLQALAMALGLGANASPDDIAEALESIASHIEASGACPPALMDAMGLPANTQPKVVAQHVRSLAGSTKDADVDADAEMDADADVDAEMDADAEMDDTAAAVPPTQMPAGMGNLVTPIPALDINNQQQNYPRTTANNGQAIMARMDYGSLKQARMMGGKGLGGNNMPYAVSDRANQPRQYTTKTVNVSKNMPDLPLLYAFHDMFMARQGMTRGFKSLSFKSMSYSTGPTGGYVLEQSISDEIIDPLRADAVVFKAGARQEDLDGTQVKSIPAMLTAPAAYWPGEAQTVTGSQPVYRMITLVPKPMAVLVQRPFNFVKNITPRAEAQLKDQIIKSLLLELDRVALLGEGGAGTGGNTGSRPLGLINIPGVTVTQLGATDPVVNNNGRAPTIKDLVTADGVLDDNNIPQGGERGWIFHSRSKRAFTGLSDSLGRPLLRETWGDSDPERELLGYPYFVENQIPTNVTTGTNTDTSYIFYGDWRYMVVGLTTRVELVLDQTYASQLLQGLLAYIYVDIAIEYSQAFNVLSGVRGA